MARAAVSKNFFTFIAGKNTESSPLVFPENTAKAITNLELKRDGSIVRRLGIDYEDSFSLSTDVFTDTQLNTEESVTHEWPNVAGDTDLSFTVIQVGTKLYFYDALKASVSANLKGYVDFSSLETSVNQAALHKISVTTGKGVLFVVSKYTEPFYVTFDKTSESFTITELNLNIRDFEGTPSLDLTYTPIDVETQPTDSVLTATHKYNLQNQGWSKTNYDIFFSHLSKYPSNAQVDHLGKDSSGDFDPDLLDKFDFGNTQATKGHKIIGAFFGLRGGLDYIYHQSERPESIAFFAGRVFFGDKEGRIFFSQSLVDLSKAEQCYQEQDPTAEDFNSLLDTDGGVLVAPEIGNIKKLVPLKLGVIIMADNGIWQISGGGTDTVTANNITITKISNIGVISGSSVVVAEDTIFFWGEGDIYRISPKDLGEFALENLTQTTINTDYISIESLSKKVAIGHFDEINRTILWLYSSVTPSGTRPNFRYDRLLIVNTITGAFYDYSISDLTSNTPYVAGIVTSKTTSTTNVPENVTDGGAVVTDSGVNVTAASSLISTTSSGVKFITFVPNSSTPTNNHITFSEFSNKGFVDWFTKDSIGVDFTSSLQTGYELLGDSMRDKQATYLFAYFNRTEDGFQLVDDELESTNPSSCLLTARWDWTESTSPGRWSSQQQVYRLLRDFIPVDENDSFDYGFTVIETKNKIRGKGKALSLFFTSEAGKDFQLLGWAIPFTSTSVQ